MRTLVPVTIDFEEGEFLKLPKTIMVNPHDMKLVGVSTSSHPAPKCCGKFDVTAYFFTIKNRSYGVIGWTVDDAIDLITGSERDFTKPLQRFK
jgi:hypothetical protein